jgi:hypothetical protein
LCEKCNITYAAVLRSFFGHRRICPSCCAKHLETS